MHVSQNNCPIPLNQTLCSLLYNDLRKDAFKFRGNSWVDSLYFLYYNYDGLMVSQET